MSKSINKEWEILYDFLLSQPNEIKSSPSFRSILVDLKRLKLDYGQLTRYYKVLLDRDDNTPAHSNLKWKIGYLKSIKSQLEESGIIKEK